MIRPFQMAAASVAFAATFFNAPSAQAEELRIWVAPSFYGWSESNCDPDNAATPSRIATKIDIRFCDLINPRTSSLDTQFRQDMRAYFGKRIEEVPGESLPPSISLDRRLRSTVAASLHITRADIWQVSRNNGTSIIYLPITVSLLLTNVASGDVIFVENLSTIAPFEALDRNVDAMAQDLMPGQLRSAITELVKRAAVRFKPEAVNAMIIGSTGTSYVINKGMAAGIRKGNFFSGDIKVLYADADYAIVEPINRDERLQKGTVISKQNVEPADYLSKHPAMIFVGATPEGMSRNYIKRVFESKLGDTKAFNIVYTNDAIEKIRTSANSGAVKGSGSPERETPQYFIYLDSFTLEPTEFSTNIPGRVLKTYEAYSVAYIIDRSGRVIYSQVASDRLVDETSGVSFPREQRQETVVSNSIDKLVSLIGAEFRPASLRLPVILSGSDILVSDPTGLITGGVDGTVLRKAGSFSDIKGTVWSPVNVSRVEAIDGRLVLRAEPFGRSPNKGDVLAVESGGDAPTNSRKAYTLCDPPTGLPSNDLSGHALFRSIGLVRFHQSTRIPLYVKEMPSLLTIALGDFKNQGGDIGAKERRESNFCVRPIFRYTSLAPIRNRAAVSQKYNMVLGYNILNEKGERLSGHGLSMDITTSPLPDSTPNNHIYNNSFRDFINQMNLNASKISKSVILQ
jgi:hypothetical protein